MTSLRQRGSEGEEEDGECERVTVAGVWPMHKGGDSDRGTWGAASVAEPWVLARFNRHE